MKESFIQLYSTHRRHLYVAAYVVLISVVALTTYFAGSYYYGSNFVVAPHLESAPTTTPSYPYVLHASKPKRLSIPKLSIDTSFEILSLNPDRSIGVPKEYTTVGWYDGSSLPGALGPSVILGHVDSFKGPGVFYHLGQLNTGDRFTIEREDGSIATFEVMKLERYKQSEFPTDLVYGPIDYAGIRLITCSGKYDRGTQRYSHNLVVYGKLIEG